MRIAIITFHRAYNCGAMLQAWALKTVLERMGHIVEFPLCNHVGETSRWQCELINRDKRGLSLVRSLVGRLLINLLSIPTEDVLRMRYRRFRKENFRERGCAPDELGKYYDLIIVGSDQVWSACHTLSDAPVFFAENIPDCVRKISYAASYGDNPLDEVSITRVVRSLEHFSHISVREPLAKKQLSQYSSKQITVTLDPTLLLNEKDYNEIKWGDNFIHEPYLFMYTLSASPYFVNTAKRLSDKLGVRCVIAPCYQYTRYGAEKEFIYSISPGMLVGLVRGAKYVLAGSFHGTVLGLLFKKPFLSLREHVDENESRPAALLNMLGLGDRLVNPKASLEGMESMLGCVASSQVYDMLDRKRQESLNWLTHAIG